MTQRRAPEPVDPERASPYLTEAAKDSVVFADHRPWGGERYGFGAVDDAVDTPVTSTLYRYSYTVSGTFPSATLSEVIDVEGGVLEEFGFGFFAGSPTTSGTITLRLSASFPNAGFSTLFKSQDPADMYTSSIPTGTPVTFTITHTQNESTTVEIDVPEWAVYDIALGDTTTTYNVAPSPSPTFNFTFSADFGGVSHSFASISGKGGTLRNAFYRFFQYD